MKSPKITVLMPVYNAEIFLKEAIDSILNQTFNDFEFIIINDGSTDQTARILQEYKDPRILIFNNQKNLGVVKSRNLGIKIAKGRYIALMDSDDISFPERLQKQVNYLDSHPFCDVIATKIQPVDIGRNIIEKWQDDQKNVTYEQIKKQLPIGDCIANPTTVIKSSVIKKYEYNEKLSHSSDYELWLRLCSDKIKIEKLNEELVYYRVRPSSITARSLRRGTSYKNLQTKSRFLLGRINQFKIGYFELKTTFYLLSDIFSFVYTKFRKRIFYFIKRVLINIGKIIGSTIPNRYSSDVFFFFPFYHTGGAEKVHSDIIKCLKTKKIPTIVFTNKSNNDAFKYLFEKRGYILDLSTLPFKNLSQYIWLGIIVDKINKCKHAVTFGCNSVLYYDVLKYLKPQVKKIDLIHAFGGGIENVSLPYAENMDYRIVTNQKTKKDLYDLYESYGFKRKLNKRVLMIELGVKIPKTLTLKKYGNIFNFIYIGRWSEEKRVYLILEAAERCYEERIPANFTIIGDIPKSVKNRYEKCCKFTGEIPLNSIKKYYQLSDFIFITSARESFPTVVMQAMAYGVVPICTNVGNIPYHIKSWKNGILIEDKTESTIVVRIVEIISKVNNSHQKVEKMSLNAYRYAKKHFDSKYFCQKYNQLVQKNVR